MKLITDMTLDMEITEITLDQIRIRIGNGNVNGYGPRKLVSKITYVRKFSTLVQETIQKGKAPKVQHEVTEGIRIVTAENPDK